MVYLKLVSKAVYLFSTVVVRVPTLSINTKIFLHLKLNSNISSWEHQVLFACLSWLLRLKEGPKRFIFHGFLEFFKLRFLKLFVCSSVWGKIITSAKTSMIFFFPHCLLSPSGPWMHNCNISFLMMGQPFLSFCLEKYYFDRSTFLKS